MSDANNPAFPAFPGHPDHIDAAPSLVAPGGRRGDEPRSARFRQLDAELAMALQAKPVGMDLVTDVHVHHPEVHRATSGWWVQGIGTPIELDGDQLFELFEGPAGSAGSPERPLSTTIDLVAAEQPRLVRILPKALQQRLDTRRAALIQARSLPWLRGASAVRIGRGDVVTDAFIPSPSKCRTWFTGIPVKSYWYAEELITKDRWDGHLGMPPEAWWAGSVDEGPRQTRRRRAVAEMEWVAENAPGTPVRVRRSTSIA